MIASPVPPRLLEHGAELPFPDQVFGRRSLRRGRDRRSGMGRDPQRTGEETNPFGRAMLADARNASLSPRSTVRSVRMGPRHEQYRWWLLDGDLEVVLDGKVAGASLVAALADLSQQIDRLHERGQHPTHHPYKLIVYKGASVVAVRPATLGIC